MSMSDTQEDLEGADPARLPAEGLLETPVICVEPDDTIASWNDAAEMLYGYSRGEIVGQSLKNISSVDLFSEKLRIVDHVLRGEHLARIEALHKIRDGSFIRVSLSLLPWIAPNGEIAGIMILVRDISRQEAIARGKDESHHWSWAVVETAVEGIVTINEKGTVEYVNPAATELFGYSPEEIIGSNIKILMPEPFAGEHDGYLSNYLGDGVKKIIGIGREVEGLRKDGSLFPIHVAVSEVRIGDKRLFTGIIHNMTDAHEAQEIKNRLLAELNRRNAELNCLYRVGELLRMSELGDPMFNAVAEMVYPAVAHSEVAGVRITRDGREHFGKLFSETSRSLGALIMAAGKERGKVEVFFNEEDPNTDTDPRMEEARNFIEGLAGILGEAIERKEAEAKVIHASKLASIGELAAGVGHEINNPINSILNCADILICDPEEPGKTRKFSTLIRSEAARIATIVGNLLTFSRQGKEQYSAARVCDIVDGVISLCGKKLVKSNIELRVDVPEDLPRVDCRSEQLQQVLMNFIINSMHALDERYPDGDPNKILTLSAHVVEESEKKCIRIIVEDRGTGIAPEHMDRIFDPFFTTKGRDKGTGLGLSISDGIIRGHGATLTVESEPGEFARFIFDLPLKRKAGSTKKEAGS